MTKASSSKEGLSSHPNVKKIEDLRRKVQIHSDHISQVSSTSYPHHGYKQDFSWNLETFKKELRIIVTSNDLEEKILEFDFIGVDCSIATAYRRIMISEVPTMAIDTVYVKSYSNVQYEEVFAKRMGLIPIKADADDFTWKLDGEEPTDMNTLVFNLDLHNISTPHHHGGGSSKKKIVASSSMGNVKAYSKEIMWDPQGDQEEKFQGDPITVVYDDVVLTHLRPDDVVSAVCHAKKGIGLEHAKWSPVCGVSHKLMIDIEIIDTIPVELHEKFQSLFPKGVIEIDEDSEEIKVANTRKDTLSREVLRHPEFADKVKISRIRDHFLMSIESIGQIPASKIFEKASDVYREKLQYIKECMLACGLGPDSLKTQ